MAPGLGKQPVSPVAQQAHELQQVRSRWTKAKKKRFARYERRQALEKEGKSLPKPPYYFPKDTAVVNATSAEDKALSNRRLDEDFARQLQERRREQQQATARNSGVLRHHMTDVRITNEKVRKLLDLHNGNQMEVVKAQKRQGMELFQRRPADTGSSAVQVVALSARIQQLQTHLGTHKKDKHSKRGLDALYVRRRKVLDYMERKEFDSYRVVVKTLGLIR